MCPQKKDIYLIYLIILPSAGDALGLFSGVSAAMRVWLRREIAKITSIDFFQQHEPLLFLFQPYLEGAFWNVQGQESSRAAAPSHY